MTAQYTERIKSLRSVSGHAFSRAGPGAKIVWGLSRFKPLLAGKTAEIKLSTNGMVEAML